MSVLEIKNLTNRYDDRFLFEKANLTVNNGEHIGVVGLNGAGKSTFINIIAGNVSQDDGEVLWLNGIRKGYLDQHADIDRSKTVMEYLSSSFSYLYEKENRLNKMYEDMANVSGADLDRLIKKSAKLQDELTDEGFYDLDAKIRKVANGLGMNNVGYSTVIGNISGGERAKLMLCKLLLESPDIMLLDEPTNFLDIEHIDWLIKYLNEYKRTFLVISHDVKFLDAVSKYIVNIENGSIKKYTGNYTSFIAQRDMNAKQHEDAYKRQQAEIKRITDYIDKNKARASTAKMAHSRQKMLDKMELVSKPTVFYDAEFSFPYTDLNCKDLLIVKGLEVGYDKTLIPPVNIHLNSSSRLWIRGTNGVGKTTLLKTLMRKIPPIKGSFLIHPEAKVLYLEQDLNFPRPEQTASQYLNDCFPLMNEKARRNCLAKAGLIGELAVKPIKNMSGGEQVRCKLAVLTNVKSNFLILDEPTNHLDVKAKEALKKALNEYEGAIILVCHEEDFATSVCTEIFDAKPEK